MDIRYDERNNDNNKEAENKEITETHEPYKTGETDDSLAGNFERNVIELTKRGFVFTEQGRLITIDDLKLQHEEDEHDQESIEKNFD
ncbi:MAG: hypothetical protein SCK28_09475 [Bacillota bacterium]|nr:hypothetical protein [Bacillota bacterium]